ncbi:brachyurin-like [Artemia franciscana]|uniref:Peptidase S1 domain-containing protein n=1 Tax=Artemia franciscana TaxID=6661 RepID=A0AA88IE80_ARTSF|nr:hypothetical protein QYM36_007497 [Artemia franciscana]
MDGLYAAILLVLVLKGSLINSFQNQTWDQIRFRRPGDELSLNKTKDDKREKILPSARKSFSDVCGIRPLQNDTHNLNKIVGGIEAIPNSWPWQVGIFIDDIYFCGGFLISDEWVMTAAHCTEGARYFDILLGSHNVLQSSEEGRLELRSYQYIEHERWSSLFLVNDISIIKLPTVVSFNERISPVCLPTWLDALNDFIGVTATPTGWGRTSGSSSISSTLQEVTVPVMANSECNKFYGTIQTEHICIDSNGGMGTCNGDSGGPLNYDSGEGVWKSLGITSFGSSFGCEAGFPDAFTRVTSYLGWISEKTGIIIS